MQSHSFRNTTSFKLSFLLFFTTIVASQLAAQEYLYKYFTIHDGLPSDYVTAMYFDKSGGFWIGTDKGLCRYDGAKANVLTTDEGLGNNMVYAIIEDDDGDIWAGTYESGITRISMSSGKPVVKDVIQKQYTVQQIKRDTLGYYWIKTTVASNRQFQLWRARRLDKPWESIAYYRVLRSLDVNENGDIYFLSGANIAWMSDYSQKNEIKTPINDDSASIFASGTKLAFFSNKGTKILDGNRTIPLFIRDKPLVLSGNSKYYSYGNKHLFYKTGNCSYLFEDENFSSIVDNNKDCKDAASFYLAASDVHDQLFLSDFGKGILLWRKPYVTQYYVPDKTGRIIKTANGIAFNVANHIYSFSNNSERLSEIPIPKKEVRYITLDRDDKIIISESNLFYKTNGRLWIDPPENFSDLSDLVFNHNSYYASSYSSGIFKINNKKFDTTWKKKLLLPTESIEKLTLYDNTLYAFTLSKGLFEINPSIPNAVVYNQSTGLPSNSVYCMYKNADTIWAGTNKGLARIHNGEVLSWNNKNGFCGNRAVCIFKDSKQRLWVLSDQYLHLLSNNKLTAIRSYPVLADDYSYINSANYDERTNNLWVGTSKKLLSIQMDAVTPDHENYPLTVSNIMVNGKLVPLDNGQLEIKNNNENISIQFANPHLSLYSLPRMYVRLLGYHDDWQLLPKSQLISFQKLPAGNYQLQTKTEGPDFGFTQNDKQVIISVLQPWYFRIWFIILFLLLFAAAAFIMSRLISKRKYGKQLKVLQAEQALELERMRISRELHDNVGSMLTVVINKLADSPMISSAEQLQITSIARATLSQLRDAIWALDKSNSNMAEWMSRTSNYLQKLNINGTTVQTKFDFPPSHVLTPLKSLHSFRIVQEASTNAMKHACAKKIIVKGSINASNEYELTVEDDGIGFDEALARKGYGLKNINKRATELGGKVDIKSSAEAGTLVKVTWPV